MGEYGREQRNQLSRAIANSEVGSRQLKGFADNRLGIKNEIFQFAKGDKGDSCYIPYEPGPYSLIEEPNTNNIGPGVPFTAAQKERILRANHLRYIKNQQQINLSVAGNYVSDSSDTTLVTKDSYANVLAEVDHILPKSKWGGNLIRNAMVLSSAENVSKSDDYPFAGFTKFRVYDPFTNVIHISRDAAIRNGAKNAKNLPVNPD